MRLLWIATKVPYPPQDGGRLVQMHTLAALAAAGVEVELVAPLSVGDDRAGAEQALDSCCTPHLVPVAARRAWSALGAARPGGMPLAIARHFRPEVRRRVSALLDAKRFDVVHAEQLHALPQAEPARRRGVPVVLRAQNVESDLWFAAGDRLPAPWRWFARIEAGRLARWEARAVGRAACTVALTAPDARRLGELAPATAGFAAAPRIEVVAAPFPADLPSRSPRAFAGSPAVVLLASGDWPPTRDSRRFMEEEVWPEVRRRLPGAVLHVFGGTGEVPAQVIHHPAPEDSMEAFVAGSILAVPLRIASGVRIKILEAWARGVPVVATPQATAGLAAVDGRDLLVAGDAEQFAAAVARLAADRRLGERLAAGGRAVLEAEHDPARVADSMVEVYRRARLDRGSGGGRRRASR